MVPMLDLGHYSSKVHAILNPLEAGGRRMPLAPAGPVHSEGLDLLRQTPRESLFGGDAPASRDFAECVRSALFLYFSALDESHTISQDIDSTTGSFLHGIMHRQEPDYSNAKYWFRRVGAHELYPTLREDALRLNLKTDALRETIQSKPQWDPMWFVDECARGAGAGGALERDLEELQRLEWSLVFDYSYRRALTG